MALGRLKRVFDSANPSSEPAFCTLYGVVWFRVGGLISSHMKLIAIELLTATLAPHTHILEFFRIIESIICYI